MQQKVFTFLVALLLGAGLSAQSVQGVWKTIDDETGEAKSHVQLYEKNSKMYGKVVKLLKSAPDKLCDKCPGDLKDKPLMNLVVVHNMEQVKGFWQNGKILDPEKGKWYTCNIWLKEGDPNVLVVRGYLGPFYRTQYWYRVQE